MQAEDACRAKQVRAMTRAGGGIIGKQVRPTIRTGRLRYTREHCASSEWGKAIGDRDSYVEKSQRAPSLHYTGYIVQTVCQFSVGRALPCWGLKGWAGAQPSHVCEVSTPRTVVYRREQLI